MPIIKPRTRGKQLVRHIARLDHENNETLYAYATFLNEPTDYVLNQLVESVLSKDKEFLAWRTDHPQSFVPAPAAHSRKTKRPESGGDRGRQPQSRREAVTPATAG